MTTAPIPSSCRRSRNAARSFGSWSGKRHARGLWTKSCSASAPISDAFSRAFLIPPEQWAPYSTGRTLPAVPRLTLPARLAPLRERPYRLRFSATTLSVLGDSVAGIALVFAVLDLTGKPDPIYLALVFAGRQTANAALVLFGGVLSDRFPRNRILVGAALGQGAAQAATAAVVL